MSSELWLVCGKWWHSGILIIKKCPANPKSGKWGVQNQGEIVPEKKRQLIILHNAGLECNCSHKYIHTKEVKHWPAGMQIVLLLLV